MKINMSLLLGVIIFTSLSVFSQTEDWRNLVALESTKENVEKLLGKPRKYFDTYGSYETETGKFSIWYSKGGCHKNIQGLQYKIPAKKMTRLYVRLHRALPIEYYITNKENYKKSKSLMTNDRYLYTSLDESIVYETIVREDNTEFVDTISIQPGKEKTYLLCKKDDLVSIQFNKQLAK